MRTIAAIIILIFTFLPNTVWAHGGVEKTVGNVTVVLTQEPLSPFVGEKVKMNFAFLNLSTGERYKGLAVNLKVIDTFEGDESKDQTVATRPVQTDANGDFDFDYTFNKSNYFDIDLDFTDPITGQDQETGFLIQTRAQSQSKSNYQNFGIGLGIGIAIGLIVHRAQRSKKDSQ